MISRNFLLFGGFAPIGFLSLGQDSPKIRPLCPKMGFVRPRLSTPWVQEFRCSRIAALPQKLKARSGLCGGGRAPPPPITSNPPGSFNICSSLPGGVNPDLKDWQSCRSPCYLGVGFVGCQSFGTGPHFVFPRSPRGEWGYEVPLNKSVREVGGRGARPGLL